MNNLNSSKIIDDLGGTAKTAVLCEVSMAAVSQWREDGIPRARLMFLRAVRPDVVPPAGSPEADLAAKPSA